MPKCKYAKCRREFEPNERNRGPHQQKFCDSRCRWNHWNDTHPRTGVEHPGEKLPLNKLHLRKQKEEHHA